ncbi:galactokinase [Pontiella sulfatireligans]|uniref:Galactokinase n=1 Tax=Pontiella sulfatireligans TaxID=2750658 RepID=A0A6C2UVY9_9BACT|nr:galactokinase [Pontiella sulfatireligans]VGO23354.1 Galactokinase [Pontiella sulfatireligans]
MYDEKIVEQAIAIHTETYGTAPTTVSYAPGRIEVLGNHTDYNEGTTFSTAINMGHCFCISASGKPGVRLTAGDIPSTTEFDPSTDERLEKKFQWANYVKGVFFYLREHGVEVDGVDCTFLGSIPMGAGLSSSAALEVATAFAVLKYAGKDLDKKDIGILAQKSENNFAGCNCGLLDQFSSIYGVHHGLIHSDFRTLETYPVKLPDDVVFLMINPHIKHTLADSPYNARRISCELAAAELDTLIDHDVKALRDVSWEEFEANKDKIDPEAAKRATHVVGEITRVEKGVKLLAEGKLAAFGQFLFDSHETSRTAFENSCDELDMVVEAARDAGALGARLSGGGWGGSVVALVHAKDADAICGKIIETCKAKGLHPTAETIIPSAGATIIK